MVRRDSRLKRDQRGQVGSAVPAVIRSTNKKRAKRDHSMSNILWGIIACGALAILYAIFHLQGRAKRRCRQCANAGNRSCRARGRTSLPQSAIPHDRHCRGGDLRLGVAASWSASGRRLSDRRSLVGARRIYRHERVGARQRAHSPGGDGLARQGSRHRLQGGRDNRHARCGPGAPRRLRLLRHPDWVPRQDRPATAKSSTHSFRSASAHR